MIRAEYILDEILDEMFDPESGDVFRGASEGDIKESMKQITWEGWIALIIIVVGPKADIPLIEKEYREKFNHWYEKEVK